MHHVLCVQVPTQLVLRLVVNAVFLLKTQSIENILKELNRCLYTEELNEEYVRDPEDFGIKLVRDVVQLILMKNNYFLVADKE